MNISEREILSDIITSSTNIEMVSKFCHNLDILKDYKIITTSDKDNHFPDIFGFKKFDENSGAGIYSIFLEKRLFFLSKSAINNSKGKNLDARIDYSISFDTQAISYVDRMFNNKEYPPIFKTAFDYIIENDFNIDGIPYLCENSSKLADRRIKEAMFETLNTFQILRTLDKHEYKKTGRIRSTLSLTENKKEVDSLIEACEGLHENMHIATPMYDKCLLLLIYIVDIHLNRKCDAKKKMNEFLYYCQNRFSGLPLRMIYIAYALFNKYNLMFFKKIQKGLDKDKLLRELENMAWDLYHIHSLENTNEFYSEFEKDFVVKVFLTFDRGLIEIINLKPVKALVYKENSDYVLPFYIGNDELARDFPYYFTDEAYHLREENRHNHADLPLILNQAKKDFLNGTLLNDG